MSTLYNRKFEELSEGKKEARKRPERKQMTKEEFKAEKLKLGKMSLKDKIIYIFSYYHVQIIILCVAVYLLAEAGMAAYRFTLDDVLYCLLVNEMDVTNSEADILEEDFRAYAGIIDKKQVTTFDISLDLEDESYAEGSLIKLMSLYGTGTVDVMVTTEEVVTSYQDQDMFLDLSDVLSDELYDALSDRFFYGENSAGELVPIGIRLQGSYLSEVMTLTEDSCLVISSMEHFPETVLTFVEYCFGL